MAHVPTSQSSELPTAALIRLKRGSRSGGILVILAVGSALILSCKQIGEAETFQKWIKSTAAAAKLVAKTQVHSWRMALLEPEVRTLRLYHVHTRESLTITYKRGGRYIPTAMARLDYFFRDWRTNTVVSMSGETIDLLWELHDELGSKQPVHVICGVRSEKTNALLKRIGRQVAARSEHLLGRAIDVQFPDVSLKALRNRALTRQAGGVGYYPAGEGGFVHIDSGRVRHWPGIGKTELAEIGGVGAGGREAVIGF